MCTSNGIVSQLTDTGQIADHVMAISWEQNSTLYTSKLDTSEDINQMQTLGTVSVRRFCEKRKQNEERS
jgi:hypothetical protein